MRQISSFAEQSQFTALVKSNRGGVSSPSGVCSDKEVMYNAIIAEEAVKNHCNFDEEVTSAGPDKGLLRGKFGD